MSEESRGILVKMESKGVRVPPEIMDRIFSHLGQERRGDDAPLDSNFEPQRLLHPLLFVCKEWHEIALRRLYSSAGVAYDIESVSARETVVVERFRTTVKDSPRLASLVKELRVSFPFAYKGTTETLVDLLSLCKRVIRVTIAMTYYGQLEGDGELLNALAELDLVALDLSGFETLRTPSEFITFMLKWPNLRKINISCGFKGQDDPSILPVPSTVRGRCPVLREIAFPWFYIHTKNLNILCEMAPNVEKLNVRPHSCTTEALPSCLRTWSSNLTSLSLGVCGTPAIASLYPKFGRLRSLDILAVCIPPDALVNLQQLETLKYAATTEHLEQLADVLQGQPPLALASLRNLVISPHEELWERENDKKRGMVALETIRKVCKGKKVDVSDFF